MHSIQRIILTADFQGLIYLPKIREFLINKNYQFEQLEPSQNNKNTYDFLAQKVLSNSSNIGVLLSGSGVSSNIYLNKIRAIRAALVHIGYIAQMSRKHNNANIMVIPTHCVGIELTQFLIETFYQSGFDGEARNQMRVQIIEELENKYYKQ